jgi:hypothetical protein
VSAQQGRLGRKWLVRTPPTSILRQISRLSYPIPKRRKHTTRKAPLNHWSRRYAAENAVGSGQWSVVS